MATQQELMETLKQWTVQLDDPAVKEKFAGFDETLQFNFTTNSSISEWSSLNKAARCKTER